MTCPTSIPLSWTFTLSGIDSTDVSCQTDCQSLNGSYTVNNGPLPVVRPAATGYTWTNNGDGVTTPLAILYLANAGPNDGKYVLEIIINGKTLTYVLPACGPSCCSCIKIITDPTYTVLVTDLGLILSFQGSTPQNVDLPQMDNCWYCYMQNNQPGSDIVTITPAVGTVDSGSTLNLYPNQSVQIATEGNDWWTSRGKQITQLIHLNSATRTLVVEDFGKTIQVDFNGAVDITFPLTLLTDEWYVEVYNNTVSDSIVTITGTYESFAIPYKHSAVIHANGDGHFAATPGTMFYGTQIKTASYTTVKNDVARTIAFHTSGNAVLTLDNSAAATTTVDAGWKETITNYGSGLITIQPPPGQTLDGGLASGKVTLIPGQSITINSDGTTNYIVGRGKQISGLKHLNAASYTLALTDYAQTIQVDFNGECDITFPNTTTLTSEWYVEIYNNTASNSIVLITGTYEGFSIPYKHSAVIHANGDGHFAATPGTMFYGVNNETSNYTTVKNDNARTIAFHTDSTGGTLTLDNSTPGTTTVDAGWKETVTNYGSGLITIQTQSGQTLDGGIASGQVHLMPHQSITLNSDGGTNYVIGRGKQISGLKHLNAASYTLAITDYAMTIQVDFNGECDITFPNTATLTSEWYVEIYNNTASNSIVTINGTFEGFSIPYKHSAVIHANGDGHFATTPGTMFYGVKNVTNNYTTVKNDVARTIAFTTNNSGAILILDNSTPGTSTVDDGWKETVTNYGSGLITIQTQSGQTLDGGITSGQLNLIPRQSITINSDGTTNYVVGRGKQISGLKHLNAASYTLALTDYAQTIQVDFNGECDIVFPNTVNLTNEWFVEIYNNTASNSIVTINGTFEGFAIPYKHSAVIHANGDGHFAATPGTMFYGVKNVTNNYTTVKNDVARTITVNGSSGFLGINLDNSTSGTTTIDAGWKEIITNYGSGLVVINPPSGTIIDGSIGSGNLVLMPHQSITLNSDGLSGYYTGRGKQISGLKHLNAATYTLTVTDYAQTIQVDFNGQVDITFPNTTLLNSEWYTEIYNNTASDSIVLITGTFEAFAIPYKHSVIIHANGDGHFAGTPGTMFYGVKNKTSAYAIVKNDNSRCIACIPISGSPFAVTLDNSTAGTTTVDPGWAATIANAGNSDDIITVSPQSGYTIDGIYSVGAPLGCLPRQSVHIFSDGGTDYKTGRGNQFQSTTTISAASYAPTIRDWGQHLLFTNTGNVTVTLGTYPAGWWCYLGRRSNNITGVLTATDPSGQIIYVRYDMSTLLISNGTNVITQCPGQTIMGALLVSGSTNIGWDNQNRLLVQGGDTNCVVTLTTTAQNDDYGTWIDAHGKGYVRVGATNGKKVDGLTSGKQIGQCQGFGVFGDQNGDFWTMRGIPCMVPVSHNAAYVIREGDRGSMLEYTGTGGDSFDLETPYTLQVGWVVYVTNHGTGNLTVTALTGLINGATTITLRPNCNAIICSDGVKYTAMIMGGCIATDPVSTPVVTTVFCSNGQVMMSQICINFLGTVTESCASVSPLTFTLLENDPIITEEPNFGDKKWF